MIEDAFTALDAIQREHVSTLAELDVWLDAFKTIKWVVKTETGLCLTEAGREAYNQMSRERSGRPTIGAFGDGQGYRRTATAAASGHS